MREIDSSCISRQTPSRCSSVELQIWHYEYQIDSQDPFIILSQETKPSSSTETQLQIQILLTVIVSSST